MVSLPRLVVAAPASGHGKTTLTIGLIAALGRRLTVSAHKVGPDYIDPGWHAMAAGRPGRNLDPVLCGPERIAPLLLHGAFVPEPADVAVIEGVMGLFDGRLGTDGEASTAHVAALTQSPVVLCVDASHTSRSIGALVHGMATWREDVDVVGVVLNKVASARHEAEVRAAVEETLPVLGSLPRDAAVEVPSRHLGLVPAAERAQARAVVDALADRVEAHVDLDAILALARTAPDLDVTPWDPSAEVHAGDDRPVIAVAAGRAFTFRYAETTELLAAAGCDVALFDPLTDTSLPTGTRGLYLGGGFPEVHAAELAANGPLTAEVADLVAAGMPTVAECAGLLYLARSLDGVPMVGAVPGEAAMHPRLVMGYREATAPTDTLLTRAGDVVRGHEFHRTRTVVDDGTTPAWICAHVPDGIGGASLHAAYLHTHWAGHPEMAQRFADAARAWTGTRTVASPATRRPATHVDLTHHGDIDAREGGLDVAVNTYPAGPPDFLRAALVDADPTVYPDPTPAREALAAHHHLDPATVLPTAGAAEAFTLLARGLGARRAMVVHPQFTEPEAALRAAGVPVHRLVLHDGFTLDVGRLIGEARSTGCDVVVIGNPTNPTAVLHSRSDLLAIRDAGLRLVVDEAFMDAVPGETESLLGIPGIVVVRSLTKLWGIPGVRVGWLHADAELVEGLARHQPPWSLSAAAIAAVIATSTAEAAAEARLRAESWVSMRADLTLRLAAIPALRLIAGHAPFVLVGADIADVAGRLRGEGVAARRATFPGLDDSWVRIAAREAGTNARVADALARVVSR